MSKTNKILLVIIAALAVINIGLFFSDKLSSSGNVEHSIFAVSDTSAINEISIQGLKSSVSIVREGNNWNLNGAYKVDAGLKRLFFSILQRVRVRKPVDLMPSDSIYVNLQGEENMAFVVFSNPTKTRTYFYDPEENQSYEVEIPGYNEYLGGIFELRENQWRDRLIIDENWRSIKSVKLDYHQNDKPDLSIEFNGKFFEVEGINGIDSSMVIDYLNQFQIFEVNEIISGERFPQYDSLSKTPPLATLTISSIRNAEPSQLKLFPAIDKMAFQLVTNKNDDLMILDSKRAHQILAKPTDFKAKE
tara:strand:- start:1051 stop:1962 length:912 start_codon:yes stop_codon:yes gene_type:complete